MRIYAVSKYNFLWKVGIINEINDELKAFDIQFKMLIYTYVYV
jgi:hypothetical protein